MTEEIEEVSQPEVAEEVPQQEETGEEALPVTEDETLPATEEEASSDAEEALAEQQEQPHKGKMGRIVGVCAGVLALLVGLFALLYWVIRIPLFDRSGWSQTESGAVCYLDYYGKPMQGWHTIGDGRYYFSPADGAIQTGWLELEDGRYFLEKDGRAYSGWLEEADGLRYLDDTGAMHVGWLGLAEGKYYFLENGCMATGWVETPEGWAFLEANGLLIPNWKQDENGRYYLDENGDPHTGWLDYGGSTYWFDEDGLMHTGWLDAEDGRYYLAPEGEKCTGWLELADGSYYLDPDGKMVTGWQTPGETLCYFEPDGTRTIGWVTTREGRFYLNEDGILATGFVNIGGVNCYFTEEGVYVALVNSWNPVPGDYAPELVDIEGFQVDATCLDALEQMLNDCREVGFTCKINAIYRDVELQQKEWDERYEGYIQDGYSPEQARKETARYVATPGTSEHHLGLAIDLGTSEDGYRWLHRHCREYGFILRYPEGKTSATGIAYEMWHFRYVGKTVAERIYDTGLCLEEYLEVLEEEFLENQVWEDALQ